MRIVVVLFYGEKELARDNLKEEVLLFAVGRVNSHEEDPDEESDTSTGFSACFLGAIFVSSSELIYFSILSKCDGIAADCECDLDREKDPGLARDWCKDLPLCV